MVTNTTASSPWDAVEHAILSAAALEPASCARIADRAGLPPDVVKAQLVTLEGAGLVTQPMPGAGRYVLTLAGRHRLFTLIDQPGHQAAA